MSVRQLCDIRRVVSGTIDVRTLSPCRSRVGTHNTERRPINCESLLGRVSPQLWMLDVMSKYEG